ncbi:MAG TPA: YdeI/OmpD-associated family protein [Glaciibacter sp.]|nr:YdeI/OmpD-associated family protein [Glaciibacter sp.]
MGSRDEAEQVHALSVEEWRNWLHANHDTSSGAWLVFWRPATGRPRVGYDDAVLEALCVGWIDGLHRPLDAERTMQWFVPRSPRSSWSRVNKERVARLEREGRLLPAGARVIEAAKASGTWSVLDEADEMVLPPDLAEALDARPPAREHWESFPASVKRGLLSHVALAKRPETRERRIAQVAENVRLGKRSPSRV